MRPEQLEAWVLSIVDRVRAGHKNEDDRVELKADWIEPAKAARRIAGHANASAGALVLWIVGLDEVRGVVPITAEDPARWWSRVESEFDGLSPGVSMQSVPTAGGGGVYALLFETSRRPFVVKNPDRGKASCGPFELEVPWREGTRVRSAKRENLIRLLVPIAARPSFELLRAEASMGKIRQGGARYPAGIVDEWHAEMVLYITPRGHDRLVFPVHRASFTLAVVGSAQPPTGLIVTMQPKSASQVGGVHSHTVATTSSEAIVDGPGRLYVNGHHHTPNLLLGRPGMSGSSCGWHFDLLRTTCHSSSPQRSNLRKQTYESDMRGGGDGRNENKGRWSRRSLSPCLVAPQREAALVTSRRA